MRSILSRQSTVTSTQLLANHMLPSASKNNQSCLTSIQLISASTWQSKKILHKACIGTRTWQYQPGLESIFVHLISYHHHTSIIYRHSSISTRVTVNLCQQHTSLTMRDARWILIETSTSLRFSALQLKRRGSVLSAWPTWPMIWLDIFSLRWLPVLC